MTWHSSLATQQGPGETPDENVGGSLDIPRESTGLPPTKQGMGHTVEAYVSTEGAPTGVPGAIAEPVAGLPQTGHTVEAFVSVEGAPTEGPAVTDEALTGVARGGHTVEAFVSAEGAPTVGPGVTDEAVTGVARAGHTVEAYVGTITPEKVTDEVVEEIAKEGHIVEAFVNAEPTPLLTPQPKITVEVPGNFARVCRPCQKIAYDLLVANQQYTQARQNFAKNQEEQAKVNAKIAQYETRGIGSTFAVTEPDGTRVQGEVVSKDLIRYTSTDSEGNTTTRTESPRDIKQRLDEERTKREDLKKAQTDLEQAMKDAKTNADALQEKLKDCIRKLCSGLLDMNARLLQVFNVLGLNFWFFSDLLTLEPSQVVSSADSSSSSSASASATCSPSMFGDSSSTSIVALHIDPASATGDCQLNGNSSSPFPAFLFFAGGSASASAGWTPFTLPIVNGVPFIFVADNSGVKFNITLTADFTGSGIKVTINSFAKQ